jgi:hypothetical protein
MSSDTDHRDAGVAFLKKTTATYPSWVAAGKPASAYWSKAFAEFDKIGVVIPPDPPPVVDVTPPAPPAGYSVPSDALSVSTTAQLLSALGGSRLNIVLEDGTYDGASVGTCTGKRLYARNLGKATVKFGLWSRGGERVQGLVFDVPDNSRCLQDSILRFDGSDTVVLDTVLKGNKKVAHALYGLAPDGAEVRRYVAQGFTDTGLRLSSNHLGGSIHIKAVSDISIDGVTYATPGGSNGTAEAGVWIGELVTEGVLRIRVRNVSWSGVEGVNNCNATRWSDLDIDMGGVLGAARVGIYAEHFCVGGIFERFLLTNVLTGFNGEWNDPVWGGKPACVNTTVRNGKIKGFNVGVYLDDGSGPGNSISNVAFEDGRVAVGEYRPAQKATLTNLTYKNVVTQYSSTHYAL